MSPSPLFGPGSSPYSIMRFMPHRVLYAYDVCGAKLQRIPDLPSHDAVALTDLYCCH